MRSSRLTTSAHACRAAAIRVEAEIVHPAGTSPGGVRRFFLRDPDGYVINFSKATRNVC